MSKQYIFVDGMESITLSDGLIKMELFNIENPSADEGEGAVHDPSVQLIMNPKSFIRSFEAMQELIEKLTAAGMISKKGSSSDVGSGLPDSSISPNFR